MQEERLYTLDTLTILCTEEVLSCPIHWTVALRATLRQVGVDDLLIPLGLDFESQGMVRMMALDAKETRSIVGMVNAPDGVRSGLVLVERLPV